MARMFIVLLLVVLLIVDYANGQKCKNCKKRHYNCQAECQYDFDMIHQDEAKEKQCSSKCNSKFDACQEKHCQKDPAKGRPKCKNCKKRQYNCKAGCQYDFDMIHQDVAKEKQCSSNCSSKFEACEEKHCQVIEEEQEVCKACTTNVYTCDSVCQYEFDRNNKDDQKLKQCKSTCILKYETCAKLPCKLVSIDTNVVAIGGEGPCKNCEKRAYVCDGKCRLEFDLNQDKSKLSQCETKCQSSFKVCVNRNCQEVQQGGQDEEGDKKPNLKEILNHFGDKFFGLAKKGIGRLFRKIRFRLPRIRLRRIIPRIRLRRIIPRIRLRRIIPRIRLRRIIPRIRLRRIIPRFRLPRFRLPRVRFGIRLWGKKKKK